MLLEMFEKTVFFFIIHKCTLKIVQDENALLSMSFLLHTTRRFYLLINIGRSLGGIGSGLLTIFRFVDQLWRNINLQLTKDLIILLAEVYFLLMESYYFPAFYR